jgi:Uma2 family endonuclease
MKLLEYISDAYRANIHRRSPFMYDVEPYLKKQTPLPTMYDLPSENPEDPGLPDELHLIQPQLLRETCKLPTYPNNEVFIGADINLYYDSRHTLWYKRPDWFIALGVPKARQQEDLRWSYVVWQEGANPFLVVELLSPGTADEDLGTAVRVINQPPNKWEVYERILRVPYYITYDRYENNLRVFQLVGARYQEVALENSRFWVEEIELGLGIWDGTYQETEGRWLRWYRADGADDSRWVPTGDELAEQANQRAEQAAQEVDLANQRAEQAAQEADLANQRAQRLAEQLRALGIDPNTV